MQQRLQATQKRSNVVSGTVDRIVFQGDTGWTVAKVKTTNNTFALPASFVGNMPGLTEGEEIEATGEWKEHEKYGLQFTVQSFRTEKPTSNDAMIAYLKNVVVGIGEIKAHRIVSHFEDRTTKAMQNADMLQQVDGIGPKTAEEIVDSWKANEANRKAIQDVVAFLDRYDIPTSKASAIVEKWGFNAVLKIKADPYALTEIHGIGFKKADQAALKIGLKRGDPRRINAAILYALLQAALAGQCYQTREPLIERTAKLLSLPQDQIDRQLDRLIAQEEEQEYPRLQVEGHAIYHGRLYEAEVEVARHLTRLMSTTDERMPAFGAMRKMEIPEVEGVTYTMTQEKAIRTALLEKVSIITGGPGTGKTTIIKAVVKAAREHRHSIALVAPTGKAAKRMEEATGWPAKTIHRELRMFEGTFLFDENNKLPSDLVVIDEASMLDVRLADHLLQAIPAGAHVVFVGDVDQLPSVGPGNVLRDMIESGTIETTTLDHIFRQSETSYIVPNAHAINEGQMPRFGEDTENDFFLFPANNSAEAADWVEELVSERIPKKFGYQPDDIQVLAPMKRGSAGVHALNARLQGVLNPTSPVKDEQKHGDRTFRVGDRVINVKNNYDKDVFNGEIGTVLSVGKNDDDKKGIFIDFDGRTVHFTTGELSTLKMAYALTIHKSQGSEFPVVVVPILNAHYVMLQRNLIYTAVTRAKELVVLVGSKRPIAIAVNNNDVEERKTRLTERLQTHIEGDN